MFLNKKYFCQIIGGLSQKSRMYQTVKADEDTLPDNILKKKGFSVKKHNITKTEWKRRRTKEFSPELYKKSSKINCYFDTQHKFLRSSFFGTNEDYLLAITEQSCIEYEKFFFCEKQFIGFENFWEKVFCLHILWYN